MSAAVEKAIESVREAIAAGRLGHAYLIQGSPEGAGRAVVERWLALLFCDAGQACGVCRGCRTAAEHTHPDLIWREPESRSRRFSVDVIRELNQFMFQKPYRGGWKVAVILRADRLAPSSANAFLKTLEEPPGQALFLLVTDSPGDLLLTVRSRCQRLLLPSEAAPQRPWTAPLLELLAADPWQDTLSRLRFAAQFSALIEAQGTPPPDEDEDADAKTKATRDARAAAYLRQVRTEILAVMADWTRDLFCLTQGLPDDILNFPAQAETLHRQAHGLRPADALDRGRACERLATLLEGNLQPPFAALAALLEPVAPRRDRSLL